MAVFHGFNDPAEQAWMLLDKNRVAAFRQAIFETVNEGDVVVDVGSGSGVLAMFAARAGAKKVYAVERTGMVELLQKNIDTNGLQDIIEVKHLDLLELKPADFPLVPNVVLGEVLGNFAPDENIHRLYGFLKTMVSDDARYLPQTYNLVFAPVCSEYLADIENHLIQDQEISLAPTIQRLMQRCHLKKLKPEELRGIETIGDTFLCQEPLPKIFQQSMTLEQSGSINGIIVGFHSQLSNDVKLEATTCGEPTCWYQILFPIYPSMNLKEGDLLQVEIRPRLITNRGTWSWKVTCGERVHYGDAMKSLVGSNDEIAEQLGLRFPKSGEKQASELLDVWADILDGSSEGTLTDLAERLQKKRPAAYPVIEDAIQDVRQLLKASAALA